MSMRLCPHHQKRLVRRVLRDVEVDVCPDCYGLFFERRELERVLPGFHSSDLRALSRRRILRTTELACPRCRELMLELRYGPVRSDYFVDRCISCSGIWLDVGELEEMLAATSVVDQVNRKKLLKSRRDPDADTVRLDSWSANAALSRLLGLPVEVNRSCGIFSAGTYGLIALNVLLFTVFVATGSLRHMILAWGMIPANVLSPLGLLTLVTSVFLHVGLMHLVGNMYFLYVFGDNIEERLGTGAFIPYYLGLGIIANVVSALAGGHPAIPHVGASGAISGLMGTYLILYPRSQFVMVLSSRRAAGPVLRLPAWAFLLIWVGFQCALTAMRTNVDVAAHLGGFAAGIAGGFALREKKARDLSSPREGAGHIGRAAHGADVPDRR